MIKMSIRMMIFTGEKMKCLAALSPGGEKKLMLLLKYNLEMDLFFPSVESVF